MIIYSQKYYNKYFQIVKHYKDLNIKKSKELYTEIHHIVPKSMGGSDKPDNLVRIPARVHFLLHWMLYRIYKTPGMACAWHMLSMNNTGNRYTSCSFEYARITMSKEKSLLNSGINNPMYGKSHNDEAKEKIGKSSKLRNCGITHPMYGKTHSEETIKLMSKLQTGKKASDETKDKLRKSHSGTLNHFYGKTHSEETKMKIKARFASNPVLSCPYCNVKSKSIPNMKRYHFNNCKMMPNVNM